MTAFNSRSHFLSFNSRDIRSAPPAALCNHYSIRPEKEPFIQEERRIQGSLSNLSPGLLMLTFLKKSSEVTNTCRPLVMLVNLKSLPLPSFFTTIDTLACIAFE